jgi:hypothetical protein
MCDNILFYNGSNHLIKSSIAYLPVMIQTQRTLVRWSSNPIKVNRWNFHVMCAKCGTHRNDTIVTIRKHGFTLNCCLNTYGEWDLSPIDFSNILEKEHILRMLENPRLNWNCRVGVKTPTPFFMFPIQICNILKLNEIISCHAFTYIHTFPPIVFMFVIYLFGRVT